MSKFILILSFISFYMVLNLAPNSAYAGKDHSHATESDDENVRNKALTSKIWWNQKRKIEALSLSEEQRHQMDHKLGDYLREFTSHAKDQKEAFAALGNALQAGNSELAEQQNSKLSQLTSTSVSRQVDIMIKVVAILTDEQRAIVAQKYPSLFSRLWLKSANPAAMQMGRTEKKGMRKKNK